MNLAWRTQSTLDGEKTTKKTECANSRPGTANKGLEGPCFKSQASTSCQAGQGRSLLKTSLLLLAVDVLGSLVILTHFSRSVGRLRSINQVHYRNQVPWAARALVA